MIQEDKIKKFKIQKDVNQELEVPKLITHNFYPFNRKYVWNKKFFLHI